MRTCGLFVVALAMVGGVSFSIESAIASPEQRWSYTLSWSPEWCGRNLSSKELQCEGDRLLVPQWLSRTAPTGASRQCQTATPLPPDIVEHFDLVMGNRQVAESRWLQEGACLGDPQKYFTRLEYTTRVVAVPSDMNPAVGANTYSISDFKSLLARSNPGLNGSSISLSCRLNYLESVNVCLDDNLKFTACSTSAPDTCGSHFKLRPNLREPR